MRKSLYLAATAAAAAVATPAAARDGSPYIGLDVGVVMPETKDVNGSIDFTSATRPDVGATSLGTVRFKRGYDIDLNAGYDFGMFRVEGEVAYKHSKVKEFDFDRTYVQGINAGAGTIFSDPDELGFSEKTSVLSGMINGMFEIGDNTGWSGFGGGGIGYAHFKEFGDSDSAPAWQAFAGVRAAVTENIDVGVKYRYFRALGRVKFDDAAAFAGVGAGSSGTALINTSQHWSSHSLMLSLSYNFYSPPPPPPPPPTQTCPDGSVIPATDTCPAPPPPPPPPPPAPERGL